MSVTAKIQTHLRVEAMTDSQWRLVDEFAYDSAVAGARIIVPAGFITDFASVPRVPVAYWLVGDTAHLAAVVHDFLYCTGIFPKAMADRVFLEAMAVTGIPLWRRWAMYLGVTYGGDLAWASHRKGTP